MRMMQMLDNFMDKHLPIGEAVRYVPYALVFKTTNYCWYKCAHCCESAGPDQAKVYIPANVIRHYIAAASWDPQFSREVVFTGGEIFSSYRFGDKQYVPTLLRICTDHNIGVDIKTNAAWARTSFADEIFNDLVTLAHEKPVSFQISLSLDHYHKNSVDNAVRVIGRLAREKCRIPINLTTFKGDEYLYDELKKQLAANGTPVNEYMILANDVLRPIDVVNDCVMLEKPENANPPFANGRAKNLAEAKKTEFPQFAFIHPGNHPTMMMAFDIFGRVTLGENSGRKIQTRYIEHGPQARPLDKIKRNLIRDAQFKEVRAILFEKWKPVHMIKKSR